MLGHERTIDHLSHVLGYIQSKQYKQEMPSEVSGILKKFKNNSSSQAQQPQSKQQYLFKEVCRQKKKQCQYEIRNFQLESQKLEWIGISFGHHLISHIQTALIEIAAQNNVKQIRFWGKIKGTQSDYFVIQGVKEGTKIHEEVGVGVEKSGEGVNYYSFWVCNNPLCGEWTLLPDITPSHINTARKIKKLFKGNLDSEVSTHPPFNGQEKHYLKAQLCRMTHSLELCPNSLYKVHEENPKLIEADDEGKVPEFAQLNTLQGWKHKNQMILNLGRCSHFIDPSLPQEEIGPLQDKLMAEDPEIQRLKGIAEDKVPEPQVPNLGSENVWIQRTEGDTQVFTKDEASLVYGVSVLKNIYWPGWVTIGYKNGYCNFYMGNGLKIIQTSWDQYTNPDLQMEGAETKEVQEPNPKQLPKPASQEQKVEEQND